MKEPGTDMFSSVTAGTLLISDSLVVRATSNPAESFLDRMIHLVEGAKRQKTPNEMALTVLLAILTLIFVIVVAAMAPVAVYLQAPINIADLIALLVALIPTTIGALLSAIGIAGIDRTFRFNVIAMSGKAVEAAGPMCQRHQKTLHAVRARSGFSPRPSASLSSCMSSASGIGTPHRVSLRSAY